MKIAFFGTPEFTVPFIEMLVDHGYAPSLVVTNPDRPVGRGMTLQSPAPKAWAEAREIHVLQPEKIDAEVITKLSEEPWDLFIVIAYGKILPEALICLPQYGTINLHYSLLPKYRGATPVESAILAGDAVTGVTIQQMRYKLDTGPILMQKEISISPCDTTLSLRDKLNAEVMTMFPEILEKIFNKTIDPIEQSEEGASHCKKISKADGEINLSDDAHINDRKYRAYYGSPGTFFYTEKNGLKTRVKINKAKLENDTFIIEEVTPENSKRMSYNIFNTSVK